MTNTCALASGEGSIANVIHPPSGKNADER
jgi:hypothetical protein